MGCLVMNAKSQKMKIKIAIRRALPGSDKHKPLDEEPESLLEVFELLHLLFLWAASFSISTGG